MAKKKDKSFSGKVIRGIRRELGRYWTDFESHVADLNTERRGMPIGDLSGNPITAGTTVSYLDDCRMRSYDEEFMDRDGIDCFTYPGLSVQWRQRPRVLTFSPEALDALDLPDRGALGSSPTSRLTRLFPSCLLIDMRDMHREYYGIQIDYAFAYAEYDEESDRTLILYVGGGPEGWGNTIESKLLLDGPTFATARDFSEKDAARRNVAYWSGTGRKRDLADYYYDPTMDDEDFGRDMDDILALACSDGAFLTEYTDGNVPALELHLADGTADVGAEDTADDKTAEEADTPKAKPLPADGATVTPEAAPKETKDEVGARAGTEEETVLGALADDTEKSTPESPIEPAPSTEELLNQIESLRLSHADQTGLLEKAVADRDFRIRTLEDENERLRKANRALEARAALPFDMRLPRTPADAARLAAEAFPDRLLILDRAIASAEAFDGDAAEVWDVLRCMAGTLHPMIFDRHPGNLPRAFQAETGYELALREDKATGQVPELAALRRVSYDGAERDMTAHVKGRGTKAGSTLRVHFLADYDRRLIVIGHCGEHLRTTRSRGL